MKVIIPVFPQNDTERRLLWHKTKGEALCIALAKNISRHPDLDLILVSDQKKVCDSAKRIGIDSVRLTENQGLNCGRLMPFGTVGSLNYLLETERMDSKDPVAVVDYRAPLITGEIVNEAWQTFFQSEGAPVVSVNRLTDHPAQMDIYFRLLYFDMLVLFDSSVELDSDIHGIDQLLDRARVTRPFYLNWLSFGVIGTHKVYARVLREKNGCRMIPADRPVRGSKAHLKEAPDLYLFERPTSARRIVNRKNACLTNGKELAAVSAFNLPEQVDCLLLEDLEGRNIHFYINPAFCADNTELRLWVFSDRETLPQYIRTLYLAKHQPTEKIRCFENGLQMVGPVLSLSKDLSIDGCVLAVLEQCTDDGTVDYGEPVQLQSEVFKVDPLSRQRTNAKTERLITGCQDLPDMFQPNGTLAVLKAADALKLERLQSSGQTVGLALDPPVACRVESEMDLIKMHSLRKTRKH